MAKYIMPNKWKKISKLIVESPDGSKVWLDVRGLVGLELPNGKYVVLCAYFANNPDEELHDGKFGPPPFDRKINVSIEAPLTWWKDGYHTDEIVPKTIRGQLLESIKIALKTLGYNIEYKKEPER